MIRQEIADRLRKLIMGALEDASDLPTDLHLSDDTFLPDLLDSPGLSSLLVRIEDEWDFVIPDEEIEPQIFEDISSLTTFVEGKLAAAAR